MYPASCQPYPVRPPPRPSSARPSTTPPVSPPSPPPHSPSGSDPFQPSTHLLSWLDNAQPTTPPPSCGNTPPIRSPSLISISPGSSLTRFKIDLRLHTKIQRLRGVPWESSPLSFPARIVEWDEAEWDDTDVQEGMEVDTGGKGTGEAQIVIDEVAVGDDQIMCVEGEVRRAKSSAAVEFKASPHSTPIVPCQIPDAVSSTVTVRSPPEPSSTDVSSRDHVGLGIRIKDGSSVRAGSSRTKLIIRRPPFNWSRTISDPSLSSPIYQHHLDADAEGESETPLNRLLDPHRIAIRLRRRAARESPRGQGKMIVGGRLKVYDDTNHRLTAILRSWEQGLGRRWDPVEAYRIMGKRIPQLEAAPPGFDHPGSKAAGIGMKPFFSPPRRKISKRLRISPEEIKKDRLLSSPEIKLSGGLRKKGRMGKGIDNVSMTRMSTAILTLQDEDDDMVDLSSEAEEEQLNEIPSTSGDTSRPYPSVLGPPIAIPQLYVPKVYPLDIPEDKDMDTDTDTDNDAIGQDVKPFTGRRIFSSSPDPEKCISGLSGTQSPQSRFSPPTPEESDNFQGWQVLHIEHPGRSRRPQSSSQALSLGLELGQGDVSGAGGSGEITPTLHAPDDASDDPDHLAERNRQILCAAIEELAREQARLTLPDWTPPERKEPEIDETPSTVADEIITTPDNDNVQLPHVATPTTPAVVQGTEDDEEEEEVPRPRLNKGKGRARPEDEMIVDTPSVPMERDRPSHNKHQRQAMPPHQHRQERRRMTYDQVQGKLEILVLEVSALEARKADLEVEGGGSPTTAGTIARRIRHINRKIERMSKDYGLGGESSPIPEFLESSIESDEQLAIRLQRQFVEEEQAYQRQSARVQDVVKKKPASAEEAPATSRPMERSTVPPTILAEMRPVQDEDEAQSWAPKLAGRQLTFGIGDEGGKSEGKKKASFVELLDRKSLYTNNADYQSEDASPGSRSPYSASSLDTVRYGPRLPVLPPASGSATPQINVIPPTPTPMIQLRPTQGWSSIDVAHPSRLDDPLRMSYLDLSDDEEESSDTEEVELEADDFLMDFEEPELMETASDSDSDDGPGNDSRHHVISPCRDEVTGNTETSEMTKASTVAGRPGSGSSDGLDESGTVTGGSSTSTLVGDSPPTRSAMDLDRSFRTPSPPSPGHAHGRPLYEHEDDDEDGDQWIENVGLVNNCDQSQHTSVTTELSGQLDDPDRR